MSRRLGVLLAVLAWVVVAAEASAMEEVWPWWDANLQLHWDMNGLSGPTLTDVSGWGRHGTATARQY